MKQRARVAIIGRANVGKSSLFNKLIHEQRAVVSDVPGTTRDRNIAPCDWKGVGFDLVDTAGLDADLQDELEQHTVLQTQLAIQKADVVLFVTDAHDGVTTIEHEIARNLAEARKRALIVVNKVDNLAQEAMVPTFYELGIDDVFGVSAHTGAGVGDMLDRLVEILGGVDKLVDLSEEDQKTVHVGIFGRPNVGKSSLLNQFLQEERVIVSNLPHTTRDAIDIFLEHNDHRLRIVDTAGIRRRGKVENAIEYYSVVRAKRALAKCDVALFVLDAALEMSKQDQRIASMIEQSYKPVIIVINKWDLIEKDHRTTDGYIRTLQHKLGFLHWAPVVFTSALTGKRALVVLDKVVEVYERQFMTIPQQDLDEFLVYLLKKRRPWKKVAALEKPKRIRLSNIRQIGTAPPTFSIQASYELHESYNRFLINRFREQFELTGTPVRISIDTPS
jgi:GTPase